MRVLLSLVHRRILDAEGMGWEMGWKEGCVSVSGFKGGPEEEFPSGTDFVSFCSMVPISLSASWVRLYLSIYLPSLFSVYLRCFFERCFDGWLDI